MTEKVIHFSSAMFWKIFFFFFFFEKHVREELKRTEKWKNTKFVSLFFFGKKKKKKKKEEEEKK